MRNVTGYTSADSSNNDGVDRVVTKKDFKAATHLQQIQHMNSHLRRQMKDIQQYAMVKNLKIQIIHSHQYRKMEQLLLV